VEVGFLEFPSTEHANAHAGTGRRKGLFALHGIPDCLPRIFKRPDGGQAGSQGITVGQVVGQIVRCKAPGDRFLEADGIGRGLDHGDLAEEVVLRGCRQARVRIG
jgi:hypothetical protein